MTIFSKNLGGMAPFAPFLVTPMCLVQLFLHTFVGHGPLLYPNKRNGPLKKKQCNKYLQLDLNHRSSNQNVCKAC